MSTKTYWAVEVSLLRITAATNDTDAAGWQLPTKSERVLSHYNGSFTEENARAAYAALDQILTGAKRRD